MGLTIERVRRFGGVAGILFVILALVAFFLPGEPPKADDSASEITKYFTDKRDDILASDYVLGLALTSFLLFLGSLRTHFGAGDRDGIRPGSIALAGGVAGTALILAGAAVFNGAVFRTGEAADASLNVALYDVGNALFFMSGFGFAVFFIGAALAVRATGALHAALAPAALVAALLQLVSGTGLFVESGFFAAGGAFGSIAVLAAILWTLAASVALLRARTVTGTASPAA